MKCVEELKGKCDYCDKKLCHYYIPLIIDDCEFWFCGITCLLNWKEKRVRRDFAQEILDEISDCKDYSENHIKVKLQLVCDKCNKELKDLEART